VISQCLDLGVVDEMIITLVPTFLWRWIPLCINNNKEFSLTLVKTEPYDTGVVKLHYKKQEALVE
jgi:dihydrofolate reductase